MTSVLSVTQALELILQNIHRTASEEVDLLEAHGRILTESVSARRDLPPWDNSAMDGYAVRAGDTRNLPCVLDVTGEIPAGGNPTGGVGAGQAVRIMTGAPLPPGADAVVRVEETGGAGAHRVEVLRSVVPWENVRRRGGDVQSGQVVVSSESFIGPAEIAMMAAVGKARVRVCRRPLAAILATGDELAELGEEPGPHRIMNSNAYALAAQVRDSGGVPMLLGIARDDPKDLSEKIESGGRADLLLISGGVSVGKYDFVKEVLSRLGARLSFWKVAMKPGHPLAFGVLRDQWIFGLPGNPASTLVTFEEFVRPALLKMAGHPAVFRPTVRAVMTESYRKTDRKTHFVRAVVSEDGGRYRVRSAGDQGSAVLSSMVRANGFIVIPDSVEEVRAGQEVVVQLLDKGARSQTAPGF